MLWLHRMIGRPHQTERYKFPSQFSTSFPVVYLHDSRMHRIFGWKSGPRKLSLFCLTSRQPVAIEFYTIPTTNPDKHPLESTFLVLKARNNPCDECGWESGYLLSREYVYDQIGCCQRNASHFPHTAFALTGYLGFSCSTGEGMGHFWDHRIRV